MIAIAGMTRHRAGGFWGCKPVPPDGPSSAFLGTMNKSDATPALQPVTKELIVQNKMGIHARPAAMIANLAIEAKSDVWLCKNGEQVDASSIIDILSLGCMKGSDVTLKIETPEDIKVLDKIINLFEKGFGEKI